MSTIEQNLIGNTAGLSRVDKVLCFFVVLLIAKERARRRGLLPPAR